MLKEEMRSPIEVVAYFHRVIISHSGPLDLGPAFSAQAVEGTLPGHR